jgi:hypothetical protein
VSPVEEGVEGLKDQRFVFFFFRLAHFELLGAAHENG